MTSVERLILSKFAAASTMMHGNQGIAAWRNRVMKGRNKNLPIGPAAIGAPKVPPGGLTDKARPGLRV